MSSIFITDSVPDKPLQPWMYAGNERYWASPRIPDSLGGGGQWKCACRMARLYFYLTEVSVFGFAFGVRNGTE